jgi:RNA polymerase sigma-70 factor (ECF subfamily)
MDDRELLQKVARKDNRAFRSLVDKYQNTVAGLAWRFVRNHQDTEDIAQEVFFNIWQKASKFRGDSDPATWIYRITVNTSLNFLRSRKKDNKLVSNDQIQAERVESGNDPDRTLRISEETKILYQALDELPDKLRIPFILNKMEDMSYQQVADTLKISLSNVQTRIHRAKKRLQEILIKKLNE